MKTFVVLIPVDNSLAEPRKACEMIENMKFNIDNKETHRESNFFNPGKKIVITKIKGVTIGFSICYDLRFPNLYRKLAKKGAEIILIPAAFTIPSGKAHWETLVRARSIENSLFIVATNMSGTHHSKRKTYGHSLLYSPWGNLENRCFSKPKILNSTINLEEISEARTRIPSIYND